MTRLDHNRAVGILANHLGVQPTDVDNAYIWGTHSPTQYPDLHRATVKGLPALDQIDRAWYENDYIPTVAKRGAAIIDARGASSAASAAQAAIDMTNAYTQERKAFGGHLFDLGAIRQRMAMNQAKVDAVRASMYHASWMHDAGQDNVKAMSGVKAWGCEVVNQVMYDCVQFHGGMGYMRESAIERMYRDARILPIGGGATEVMLEEVAKRSYG